MTEMDSPILATGTPPARPEPSRPRPSADALLVLAVIATGLLAVAACGLYLVWDRWQQYEDFLATHEPRAARLAGIHEAQEEISAALAASRHLAAGIAYPSNMDSARVASELQNRVRDVFQGAGMSVAGSQQVAPREAVGHEVIGLIVTAQGELPQLVDALRRLEALTPKLRVEQMTVRSAIIARSPVKDPAQRLSVELRLTANRLTAS